MCLCELFRGLCAGIVYLFCSAALGLCRPQVVLFGLHQGFRFLELGFRVPLGFGETTRGSSFRILGRLMTKLFSEEPFGQLTFGTLGLGILRYGFQKHAYPVCRTLPAVSFFQRSKS